MSSDDEQPPQPPAPEQAPPEDPPPQPKPPRRKVTELLDVQAPPPARPGDESEHDLVARVRYLAFRRPVLKAVVAAALLAPAAGQDVLEDGDRPFVLLLCTLVTWLLLVATFRIRGGRGPTVKTSPNAGQVMRVWCLVSLLGLLSCCVAVFVRSAGTADVALLLQGVATAGSFAVVWWVRPRRDDKSYDPNAPLPQPSGYEAFIHGQKQVAQPTTQALDRAEETAPEPAMLFRGTAIACSGGGIRSAAFCLGGLQRLRDCDEPGTSLYDGTDRVYAVSGGGYIATALHMARRHSEQDETVQQTIFAPGSPEEDWLRRRSKFLLPTGSTRISGVLSILYGIAVNVTLIGVGLYWVALYVGWVHQRITVVCPQRGPDGAATCLNDGTQAMFDSGRGTAHGGWFWFGWGVLVLGLGMFVLAKVLAKYRGRGRLALASMTQTIVGIGLGVGALIIVLPWLVVVLNNATLENKPTQTVARVMAASRLATPAGCLTAVENDFSTEAVLAWGRATPKQRTDSVPFTYGGCGGSWTDDAVVFAPGGTVALGPEGTWCDMDPQRHPVPSFCDDRPGRGASSLSDTLASWLTAVIALAAGVRSLLKAGQASAPMTRRGAALDVFRRLVVPWLAGGIVVVAAFVVLLVLVRDNLLFPERLEAYRVELYAILVVLAIRLFSDAMLSSLHPFYRERLSDAFLVFRKDSQAQPLPYKVPTHVADNGALKGPNLVVCCTVNISDPDYIPAARGCAPFQFRTGPGELDGEPVEQGLIGISDARLPQGRMRPADAYSATSDPQGLDTTVAAAMAASAAAFSPVVGRMSGRVRPYRMLLALANARLGVWLPNPYLVDPRASVQAEPRDGNERLLWLWRRAVRPGPLRIFREAFGSMTIDDTRVYVTDGGHYDNTAMVEALRDRPRTLFVLDASADAEDSLDALSDAIVTARMDLGLVVRPSPPTAAALLRRDAATSTNVIPRGAQTAVSLPQRASQAWMHLQVSTVRDPETVVSDVWFVKNVRTAEPNLEIDGYAADNPAFPVTSTGNQFYGEYDFEAYRLLGYTNTTKMLDAFSQATGAQDNTAPKKPV
ncbi:hypothetical protein ACPPVT_03920 [Angustibacter sp. McL0619]|uniref:hypothetical protein n=1 Tax=Angustibacter sp. McL0619 TaxID=3415676 RepID=UPI003CF1CB85